MRGLRFRLPPLNGVIAFEAVARHMSVTRAAEELLVSREAVSRQIRLLEQHLGIKLFIRMHRSLELTHAGREFEHAVKDALERLAASTTRFKGGQASRRVSLTTTVALSYCWLTPRLSRLRERLPEVELHVIVSDTLADMVARRIDAGLLYGDGKWVGLKAAHLFDIESFPVCAPQYLRERGPLRTPKDLLSHRLLNLDGEPHAMEDWNWWLEQFGIRDGRKAPILGFDSYANVIQAAIGGQGIALGYSPIIDGFLVRGELVRPINETLNKGLGVYLTYPAASPISAEAKALGDWILEEARNTAKRSERPRRTKHAAVGR